MTGEPHLMADSKPEHEFFPVTGRDWTTCEGVVPELTERILARIPGTGVATRILNFAPGTDTTPNGVQVHDFWEEVYILGVSRRPLMDKIRH